MPESFSWTLTPGMHYLAPEQSLEECIWLTELASLLVQKGPPDGARWGIITDPMLCQGGVN
jgi:hypothetical protein